jgi:hypothetical protein
VLVDELGELVVAIGGVAAAAVGVAAADRDVVVAGDRLDPVLAQQRPDRVAVGAEAAEVAEVEDSLTAPRTRVGKHRLERVGVGVGPAEGSDPHSD